MSDLSGQVLSQRYQVEASSPPRFQRVLEVMRALHGNYHPDRGL